jgi:hypothetical protein
MQKPKSIIQRSGLLALETIAEMFCLKKDTFLEKWHEGEPIIRELELRKAGKLYVADERSVWKVLEKYKDNLEPVTPRWRNDPQRHRNNRIP